MTLFPAQRVVLSQLLAVWQKRNPRTVHPRRTGSGPTLPSMKTMMIKAAEMTTMSTRSTKKRSDIFFWIEKTTAARTTWSFPHHFPIWKGNLKMSTKNSKSSQITLTQSAPMTLPLRRLSSSERERQKNLERSLEISAKKLIKIQRLRSKSKILFSLNLETSTLNQPLLKENPKPSGKNNPNLHSDLHPKYLALPLPQPSAKESN